MARRRVFRTRVECPGIQGDFGLTANKATLIGRAVTFDKATPSHVNLLLDGAVVGTLDAAIGEKVAFALDRGQVFTATVENAFPTYTDKFKPKGASLDLKVEYLLEKGESAIETEKCWRCVPAPEQTPTPRSFFTTVAGVTFEGRQRIVARCSVGERLILVREPENPHDNGAIKVMRLNGEQLGFIPAHVSRGGDSSGLAYRMDRGDEYQCRISDLTGGGSKSLGVNIEITDAEEVQRAEPPALPKVARVEPVPGKFGIWVVVGIVLLILVVIIAVQRG